METVMGLNGGKKAFVKLSMSEKVSEPEPFAHCLKLDYILDEE